MLLVTGDRQQLKTCGRPTGKWLLSVLLARRSKPQPPSNDGEACVDVGRSRGLGPVRSDAGALRYDLAGVLVQGAGLGNGFHRFLDLRVGLELDLGAFLLAEAGKEDFLLDLALDPVEVFADFGLGVANVVLAHIVAQVAQHSVVNFKALGDGGPRAEVEAREAPHTLVGVEEDVGAQQGLFELAELRRGDLDVRRDATAAGYLAATVGELDLRRMLGNFALVVIFVERDGFVVALNETAAGRVVTRGGKREAGVFAEWRDGLHQALAESGFADDEAAIMVLHGARNDFGGGGGIAVHENYERDVITLIAANGVVAALGGSAAVVRDDELIFVEEHVADSHGFVEQAARIAAHVENQAVERGRVQLLECISDFAVGGFVEAGEADVADAGSQ